MALATHVANRYPGKRLVQLTNPNDQDATTVNSTLLGYAVADVQADFLTYCATTYDDTDAQHIRVAVAGVIATLGMWKDQAGDAAQGAFDRYLDLLRSLAKVTGRDRVVMKSKSILTPTAEQTGSEIVAPDTDRPYFEDLIPDPPQ